MSGAYDLTLHGPQGVIQTLHSGEGFFVLGSGSTCAVCVAGEGVAPEHAKVLIRGAFLEVEDLNTAAGTEVNGVRIHENVEVELPASVQVGEVVLVVELSSREPDSSVVAAPVAESDAGEVVSEPEPALGKSLGPARMTISGVFGGAAKPEEPSERLDIQGCAEVKGEYVLLREIARGGMGMIFEGQDSQLKRKVAVKVSSKSFRGEDPRFFREMEVLALLAHPNIVPIYTAGTDEFERPFYSMKLVKGRTLEELLVSLRSGNAEDKKHFPRERLLNVFQKVCDAIAFAHSKEILHRDLKPENVMVGEFGEVQVMDWGLAKIKGEKELVPVTPAQVENTNLGRTMEGEVVGTPQYMSPEQARGMVTELDERSDIYGLGAILYALLTLRPPVEGETLHDILTKVKEGKITSIETKVSGVTKVSGTATGTTAAIPDAFTQGVPAQLAAVVRKAMSMEREKRYATVEDFSADIEAYLRGFATKAEGAGVFRQLWLFVRRHKAIAAMVLVLIAAGAGFTVKLAASERVAVEQARVAKQNAQTAAANAERALQQEKAALLDREAARKSAARAEIALAEAAEKDFDGDAMQQALAEVPEDLRDQNWQYLNRRLNSASKTILAKELSPIVSLLPVSLKKGTYITVQQNGWVRSLDSQSGNFEDLFRLEIPGVVAAAVSRDGKRIAIARNLSGARHPDPYTVEVRSLPGGERIRTYSSPSPTRKVGLSSDGSLLFCEVLQEEEQVRVSEVSSGTLLWTGGAKGLVRTDLTETGKGIRVLSKEDGLVELDAKTGAVLRTLGKVPFFANGIQWFSPAGAVYEIAGPAFRKTDPEGGRSIFERKLACTISTGISCVVEGKGVVTLSRRSESCAVLQFWDPAGNLIKSAFYEGGQGTWHLATHPQTFEVAVAHGSRIKIWRENETAKPLRTLSMSGATGDAAFLGNANLLLRISGASTEGKKLEVFDKQSSKPSEVPVFQLPLPDRVQQHTLSGNGQVLVLNAGDHKRGIRVFHRNGAQFAPAGEWIAPEVGLGFSLNKDGSRLWFGNSVYETATGKLLCKLERSLVGGIWEPSCTWINSERLLAISNSVDSGNAEAEEASSRILAMWDAQSGALLQTVPAPNARLIALSPDGLRFAEAGADSKIRVRNTHTLQVQLEFRSHEGELYDVQWHPRLPVVVSAGYDSRIRAWDPRDGRLLEDLFTLTRPLSRLLVSPDGSTLGVVGSLVLRFFELKSFQATAN
jgi:serine/threonine protein kinase/WD40 repeat protein